MNEWKLEYEMENGEPMTVRWWHPADEANTVIKDYKSSRGRKPISCVRIEKQKDGNMLIETIDEGITWGELKERMNEMQVADHIKVGTGLIIRTKPIDKDGGGTEVVIFPL